MKLYLVILCPGSVFLDLPYLGSGSNSNSKKSFFFSFLAHSDLLCSNSTKIVTTN